MMGFTKIKEFLFKCDTCGKEVESGIINISGHWAECAGKQTMDSVNKISNTPLTTEDKLEQVKKLFGIH